MSRSVQPDPSSRPPRLRFATLLLGLVLVVLVPALGVGGLAVWQAVGERHAAAEARLRDTAQALGLAVDREFAGNIAALSAFATSPAFLPDPATPDIAMLDAHARRLDQRLEMPIIVLTRDGTRLISSRVPFGAPLPRSNAAELLDRIFATGQPAAADLVVGAIANAPVYTLGVPVKDTEGRVVLVAAAAQRVERMRALLAEQGLSAGAFAMVMDGRHAIVARSDAQHARVIGQSVPAANALRFAAAVSGLFRGLDLDGEERVFAHRAVPSAPGWTVVVAQPAADFDAAWRRPLLALTGGGFLALALGVALAVLAARGVLVPVRQLEGHARSLADGSPPLPARSAAAIPPAGITELEALRQGFAAAEGAVAAREAALAEGNERLRESEARLRLASEAGRVGFFTCDLASGETHWTEIMYRLHGLDPAQPAPSMALDGEHLGLVHPEDRAELRARRSALAADPAAVRFALEFRICRGDTGEVRWISSHGEFTRKASGQVALVRGAQQDVTERRTAEQHLRLMVHELNHRVKNTLVTVQSIASQSLRGGDPGLLRGLQARLLALSSAHDVLTREAWASADMNEVVAGVLAPHGGARGMRFQVSGPPLRLVPRAAVAISMALHELATNAVKYGALSGPAGHVEIRWAVVPGAEPLFRLSWEETGGPPVAPPTHRGFGSRLVERSLAYDIRGTARISFNPAGVACHIEAPLAAIAAAAEVVPLPPHWRHAAGSGPGQ